MYRAALIYNPFAGKLRRNPGILERVLVALGDGVRARPTYGPLTAAAVAREAIAEGAEEIIAFGGDGTINEVANGVVGSGCVLGVLPGGTANVLCVETGIGTNPIREAGRLFHRPLRQVTVGRSIRDGESRAFLLMGGAGLDAQIVHTLNPKLKKHLGKAAYWIGGFSSVCRRLPEFPVTVDGKTYTASFALVSRVRNYGGDLEIARSVRMTDLDFEIVLFTGPWATRYLKYFYGVMTNTLRGMPGVHVLRGTDVRIGGQVPLQVDGEVAGFAPVRWATDPERLTMRLPRAYGSPQ